MCTLYKHSEKIICGHYTNTQKKKSYVCMIKNTQKNYMCMIKTLQSTETNF